LTTEPSKPSAIAAHEGGPAGALRPDHEAQGSSQLEPCL
jgi:hypothetical protein